MVSWKKYFLFWWIEAKAHQIRYSWKKIHSKNFFNMQPRLDLIFCFTSACLLASAYTIVGSPIRDETGTWNPVFVYPNSKTKMIITPHWLISPKPILFHLNSKYQKKEFDGQPVTPLYLILWYTLYSDPKKLHSLTILNSCHHKVVNQ